MFEVGFAELLVLGVIALLVVGPDRIPGLARTVGIWVGKAQRLVGQVRADIEREVRADEIRKAAKEYSPTAALADVRKEVEGPRERGLAAGGPRHGRRKAERGRCPINRANRGRSCRIGVARRFAGGRGPRPLARAKPARNPSSRPRAMQPGPKLLPQTPRGARPGGRPPPGRRPPGRRRRTRPERGARTRRRQPRRAEGRGRTGGRQARRPFPERARRSGRRARRSPTAGRMARRRLLRR